VSGNGHHELAPRLEPGGDRGERGVIVIDMLDDVERADEIVIIRHPLELGQWGTDDDTAQPLLRQRRRFIVELEPVDVAETGQHREIVPGAAADFEDAGIGSRVNLAADELGEDSAARPVPPMAVVELGHLLVDDAFHQRNTNCLFRAKVARGVTKIAGMSGHQVGPCIGPVRT